MWASNRAPRGCSPHGSVALVADARELVAERLALGTLDAIGEVPIEQSREHPGRDHRGGEARALLVGPVDDLDRRFRLDACIVEGAHRLQRGQHAEYPVELAAVGLGVQMTARGHRRQVRIASRTAREHVAHLVHGDRAAGLLAPGGEEVARVACRRPWSARAARSLPRVRRAPIFAISMMLAHRRAPSTRRLPLEVTIRPVSRLDRTRSERASDHVPTRDPRRGR